MINNNIYIVSYSEFKRQLLPTLLRKPKLMAWIQALITPLVTLYDRFYLFKNQAIYKTEHNASVTLLEKALNDSFDNATRAIYINNALVLDSEHYYDDVNGEPLYFYDDPNGAPQYFLDSSAYNVYGSDFTVFLPAAIRPIITEDEERLLTKIRALLDYYKLFGTKYTLVWLN